MNPATLTVEGFIGMPQRRLTVVEVASGTSAPALPDKDEFISQQRTTGRTWGFLEVQQAIARVMNARQWAGVKSVIGSFATRAADWGTVAPDPSLTDVALNAASHFEDLGLPWPQVYRAAEGDIIFTWRRFGPKAPAVSIESSALLLFSLDSAAPVEAQEFSPISAADLARVGRELRAALEAGSVT